MSDVPHGHLNGRIIIRIKLHKASSPEVVRNDKSILHLSRKATPEISQTRSVWGARDGNIRPEGTMEHKVQRVLLCPFRTKNHACPNQTLSVWLISGCSFGARAQLKEKHNCSGLMQRPIRSPQVLFVILNLVLLQEHHVFLLKRFCPMMVRLIGDIFLHHIAIRHADRECRISWLPGEIFYANCLVNPARRGLLTILDKSRK